MTTIDIDSIHLDRGSHASPDEGMCVMEAVSMLAGEPFGDAPSCVSPVIRAFVIAWNDQLDRDDRDRLLKPFLRRVIGTATGPEDDETRAWMATDWLVRVHTPAWLRLAGLTAQAERLESLAPLDAATTPTIMAALQAVREDVAAARAAAWDAAGDDAGAAARDAAWAAARDAARDAARAAAADAAWAATWAATWAAAADAAWDAAADAVWAAAWDAAGDAAWDAARDTVWAAAWAATGDAARAALAPTVATLQDSACDLLDRMCAVGVEQRQQFRADVEPRSGMDEKALKAVNNEFAAIEQVTEKFVAVVAAYRRLVEAYDQHVHAVCGGTDG